MLLRVDVGDDQLRVDDRGSDVQAAEPQLRLSVTEWLKAGARVQAAHVRVRLCEALLAVDDAVAAELELSAAESIFRLSRSITSAYASESSV